MGRYDLNDDSDDSYDDGVDDDDDDDDDDDPRGYNLSWMKDALVFMFMSYIVIQQMLILIDVKSSRLIYYYIYCIFICL